MSDLIELFYMCITVMEMKLTEVIRVSGPRDMRRRKKKSLKEKRKVIYSANQKNFQML